MSFLAPLFLLLGAGIVVPLVIHLMRRRIGMRIEFPAARYLMRAEREHSRTLRIRNLLLMMLRVGALLAIAMAAARPVASLLGGGHAPTAIAIVIDNSLSSSVVVGGRPLLDRFKAMARDVVDRAMPSDRLWLVTADGRVQGGAPTLISNAIDQLEPIAGSGDLSVAMARAASIVRGAGQEVSEIALLTDGQRTAWTNELQLEKVQLLLWIPSEAPPSNRAVTLAEARPVRWTPRGAIAARLLARDSTTYRVTLGDRTLARGTAAPNEEIVVNAAPSERGWVGGTVELEPDEFTGDNVRHFAVWIGAAPGVGVSQSVGPFVKNAVDVLRSSERVVEGHDIGVVPADEAALLPALIVAPSDPVKVGAANRALERLGIPWRFGARRMGEGSVRGSLVDGASVSARYDLVAQSGAQAETLATAGRDPWIVAGPRYVLVGSPITPEATTLPVRAAFIPWLASLLTERLVGEPGQVIAASPGARIPRPRWADAMEAPDHARIALGEMIDVPSRSGTWFFTRGDRRVGALVVDASPSESLLDRFTPQELAKRLHADRVLTPSDAASWSAMAFRSAARRSLVEAALLLALILLGIEATVIGAMARRGT